MPEQLFPEPTVGGLIINPEGKLFLMQSYKWWDRWVIPGGHIELGESIEEALSREVEEETGLKIYDIEFLLFQEFIYDDVFWKRRHFIFFDYVCKTDMDEVRLNSEGQAYRWVTLEEAFAMQIDAYTRRMLARYVELRDGSQASEADNEH
jgi:nucleoside triphosphatase